MEPVLRGDRAAVSLTPREVAQAEAVLAFIGQGEPLLSVRTGDGQGVALPIPAELSAVIVQMVDLVGSGHTVTISGVPAEVTTTVAARMLNISRPTLMKLVRDNRIPAHRVGAHTRLWSKDILAYQADQLTRQSDSFDELRAMEERWDIQD